MPIYKVTGVKRNGLQRYRVIISYNDSHGKRIQLERTAYGIEAAKETEYRLRSEYKSGTKSSANITMQELYNEYLLAKRHEVRESTYKKSVSILERHILPYLGNVRIKKINTPVLQRWKEEIGKKALTVTMKKNIYKELSAMLNFGVKVDHLVINPLKKVGNFTDAYATKKEINYYTADEFKQFITVAKREAENNGLYEYNYYVFFCILFYLGLRKGEANALKWSDIENKKVHIRRSISQKLGKGDVETPPKNMTSNRDLSIPTPLMEILKEHYKMWSKIDGFSDNWRICGGQRCLRDTSISNRNNKYSKEAGLKTIRIHDFRHSHASLLANEGINIQEIARRLGHAKYEITLNTYAHLYPREEDRAISVLNTVMI